MNKMYVALDKNLAPVGVSSTPFSQSAVEILCIHSVTTLDNLVSLMQDCNVPITVSPEFQEKL